MMSETVEQGRGHLGVAEDGRPFAAGEVGGDDDRGALVEPAHRAEEQLPAGLGEGQVAELVEDDELVCCAEIRSGALRGPRFIASGADNYRTPGVEATGRLVSCSTDPTANSF